MSLKPCSIGVPGWAEALVAQSVGARTMTAMKESRPCLDFVFVICIVLSIGHRGGAQDNIFSCDSWHALAVMYPSRAQDTCFCGETMSRRSQRFVISESRKPSAESPVET